MIEIFYETTDHLQQFRADKLFSIMKPLRFPQLVSISSFNFAQIYFNTSKGFRGLLFFVCDRQIITFFSVFPKVAFLSFIFFCSGSQLCVIGLSIRELFFSGLLDMK